MTKPSKEVGLKALRQMWSEKMKGDDATSALSLALDLTRAKLKTRSTTAYRPIVATLETFAESYAAERGVNERVLLGIADAFCQELLKMEPGDEWASSHQLTIRRRLVDESPYEDVCWNCKSGINSLRCPRCAECNYYKCLNCAKCFCGSPKWWLYLGEHSDTRRMSLVGNFGSIGYALPPEGWMKLLSEVVKGSAD